MWSLWLLRNHEVPQTGGQLQRTMRECYSHNLISSKKYPCQFPLPKHLFPSRPGPWCCMYAICITWPHFFPTTILCSMIKFPFNSYSDNKQLVCICQQHVHKLVKAMQGCPDYTSDTPAMSCHNVDFTACSVGPFEHHQWPLSDTFHERLYWILRCCFVYSMHVLSRSLAHELPLFFILALLII